MLDSLADTARYKEAKALDTFLVVPRSVPDSVA